MRATSPSHPGLSHPSLAEPPFLRISTTPTPDSDMVEVPLTLDTETSVPIAHTAISPVVRRSSHARVPNINTMAAPLPWNIDETGPSSPYTPIARKSSYAPPPRRNPTISQSAMPVVAPAYYQPTASTYPGDSVNETQADRRHPPRYVQDHQSSFNDREISTPTYSNASPFYQNSFSSGYATPMTRTRRGRGILDNDPDLYLRGEEVDDESVWNTAAKWAKAAGKRLSMGEQQIWKMMNAVAHGDHDR